AQITFDAEYRRQPRLEVHVGRPELPGGPEHMVENLVHGPIVPHHATISLAHDRAPLSALPRGPARKGGFLRPMCEAHRRLGGAAARHAAPLRLALFAVAARRRAGDATDVGVAVAPAHPGAVQAARAAGVGGGARALLARPRRRRRRLLGGARASP